jgi:GTP-binding protein YchF
MGVKCGIIGLPNVGKSTLFNCLTQATVAAENYPFCTIDPNLGLVTVPDPRLDAIANIVKPKALIATTVEFVDIAGLVAGAAQGAGLGNKFLAHIRETDALLHVVRCFADDQVLHVANNVDPGADLATINTELALADLEVINKHLLSNKATKTVDKSLPKIKDVLEKIKPKLNQGTAIRCLNLDPEETAAIKHLNLLTAKPMLYIANVADNGFTNNHLLTQVYEIAASEAATVIPLCATLEEELLSLPTNEKQLFLATMEFTEPGLNRVIRAGYELLGLETYFTAGVKEVRAWTIPKHSSAPQAAGAIHSDFTKGFIRAEVIAYQDFIKHHGEQGAKEAGKWRLEGKEYIVQDGDIIFFRFKV